MIRQEFAKARWGSDACGMFRQSRSLTDRTGAVWWGVLWSGSLGHERFRLARLGWAVKAGKVAMRNGEVRSGEAVKDRLGWVRYVVVRQEVCKGIGAVCSGEVR
jgi:hypothetical protein